MLKKPINDGMIRFYSRDRRFHVFAEFKKVGWKAMIFEEPQIWLFFRMSAAFGKIFLKFRLISK